ncbi:MAG: hypothetical protein VX498_05510, partial [Myxococcota bacterium]|nr:hypothetical protein [Myxococcota bacterium]
YQTFPRLVDVGVQIEPGVTVDIGRNFGVFLRVPITIGLHEDRARTSSELPRPIIDNVEAIPEPPFGMIRVVLGVQGRLFGRPVQFTHGGPDEDILEEDE